MPFKKKVFDRHLQANVGQCRNANDEHKVLALQSSSPSHKKERKKERNKQRKTERKKERKKGTW